MKHKNINPLIFEKTKDGEVIYDIYSRLVKDRIIFLAEEVTADTATIISATLLFLDHQNHDKDISLYINSPGGTVHDGLFTIYDTMQFIKAPVKTVCIGEAYSAAAVILCAGEKGKRGAFPNANIMIHQVQIHELDGSGSQIEKESKRIKKLNDKIFTTIARHTGNSVTKVKRDCEEDFFLTSEEALEYGLIDAIVQPQKELPELVSRKKK